MCSTKSIENSENEKKKKLQPKKKQLTSFILYAQWNH